MKEWKFIHSGTEYPMEGDTKYGDIDMTQEHSPDRYRCDYCDRDISILTKKLQQHETSKLWMKHGQCCATCDASSGTLNLDSSNLFLPGSTGPRESSKKKKNKHNTNLLIGLERAMEVEEKRRVRILRKIENIITTGRIIIVSGLLAALILFYYEFFVLALIGLIVSISGFVLCRLGVLKRCRVR